MVRGCLVEDARCFLSFVSNVFGNVLSQYVSWNSDNKMVSKLALLRSRSGFFLRSRSSDNVQISVAFPKICRSLCPN